MSLRVISGSAKGRRLKQVPGDSTRPIMDRVKENLFNILRDEIYDARWLDLFAGTGQIGIEALSRGARDVVFLDNVRAAVQTIEHNLKLTKLQQRATVHNMDAFSYLDQPRMQVFDLIYIAPPQYKKLWQKALQKVDERPLSFLSSNGLVVVQIDPKEYEDLPLANLSRYNSRVYGNTRLDFYEVSADL